MRIRVSCSHKKKVLDFLDQLCSFYERKFVIASSTASESTATFIDKICELAEANGLPSKDYRSSLTDYSAGAGRKRLGEVYNY